MIEIGNLNKVYQNLQSIIIKSDYVWVTPHFHTVVYYGCEIRLPPNSLNGGWMMERTLSVNE